MSTISYLASCIALITAIVGLVITIKNNIENGDDKREKLYYDNILCKFITYSRQNKSVSLFINSVDIYDYYVPPYIRYICELDGSGRFDILKKVFIVDYIKLYENDTKLFYKISRFIGKVGIFILSGCMLMLIFVSIVCGMASIIQFINKNSQNGIAYMVLFVLCILFMPLYCKSINNDISDMYSTKLKTIKKRINKIDKDYNRIKKNNYV